jgi:hypothetical protein
MEAVALPFDKVLPVYDEFCSMVKKYGMQRCAAGFGTNPSSLWVGYVSKNSED